MSTYNGRRGPNVSQYIRDLNSINPQDAPAEDTFMEDDLSLFTNTQFFDFDSGRNMDFQAQPVNVKVDTKAQQAHAQAQAQATQTSSPEELTEMPNLDFMTGDFNFGDFGNAYPGAAMGAFAPEGSANFQAMPANQGPVFPQSQGQFPQNMNGSTDKRTSEPASTPITPGRQMNFEEASRHAAEEDKRKRNTAASARFRIKKKQREQALEKSAKDMSDRVSNLENKVTQLETENKWLKNLLVEKNEGNDEIASLWKEFTKHAAEKTKGSRSQR